ncbi:dentin sialophosphoprotein-like isoform X5 [Phyllopteryx taeniolatus]|nr:dentin sialophosphoprotein-like isoform X5 [Phyllopteryx taeniolatus]XP_061638934.1 dentin sialophosphoprotein-like isoform X5 [Phyllopteryx taeniolatus]
MSGLENHDEESDYSEEEIRGYARDIGIEPESEQELLWLAREAIFARLPPGWAESQDESGNPIFHNHYLQTSTNEHPCKVQYRQLVAQKRRLVAQERERIQRMAAVGGSVSQLDKKENEEAINTPTGLFCSGFLNVISSRYKETSSLTLLSLDDEEDGIISEKEDSGGTASGDQAEEMTKSKMQDKAHSGDKTGESPLQQLSGEFPISDNSVSCDSQLEMDEKGEDEETGAAKGPDELGHDSSGEDNHSGPVDQECEHIPCTDAVWGPGPKQDQEKEETIKAPGRFFCSGFLSVLASGQDEGSIPSIHDDEDNAIIYEKEDSRSSDTDLIEQPQMQDKVSFADHSTNSSDQQITGESLDSSGGSDSQLDIDVKEEDGETEVVKSLDESEHGPGEKSHFSPETRDHEYIQMPSSSSSIGALVAEKDKQLEEANKTLGLSENSIHCDCQLGMDVKDREDKVTEAAKRQDVHRSQVDQGHEHIQSTDAMYHSEAKQSPQEQDIRDCGADPSEELAETHPDYSTESLQQQVPSELLESDGSVCCDSQLERDVQEGEDEENVVAKSKDVYSCLINQEPEPIQCTVSDSGGEHDQEKEKLIKTPEDKRGNNAELAEEMSDSEMTDSDCQCIESTKQQFPGEFLESGNSVSSDSHLEMDVKEGEDEETEASKSSQDESGHDPSCKQGLSKSVAEEYGYIQGIDDIEGSKAKHEKEDEEESTKTDSRNSNEETEEITEPEMYEKALSEDQKKDSTKQWLNRDDKEEVDEEAEAAKSQLGQKSSREDVQNHKLIGHTDNVGRSEAKQGKEEDELIILSSEYSAVAIRDGDLAEEMTELEAQSEDQSPESPRQEVSERVLDSSDSVFETSSKSQDESGNDSSVEDVYSDIVAQECEHIQCDNTVGRSEAKHKEEREDHFSRTGSHLVDQEHELIQSTKVLGVSKVEDKDKFIKTPGLLTDFTDSDDSFSRTDSQPETNQDIKSQDESGYDAFGSSGDEQDKEEEEPNKTPKGFTAVSSGQEEKGGDLDEQHVRAEGEIKRICPDGERG